MTIVGVKRADKRRVEELGVEVRVKESFKKSAGYVKRIVDKKKEQREQMPERARKLGEKINIAMGGWR